MKCDLCKAEVEKLYTFFDKEICKDSKLTVDKRLETKIVCGIIKNKLNKNEYEKCIYKN